MQGFGNLHVEARVGADLGDPYQLAVVVRVEESAPSWLEVRWRGQILITGDERSAGAANLEHQRVFVIVE